MYKYLLLLLTSPLIAGTATVSWDQNTEPDKNSDKIGNLLRGDEVRVLETKDGWAKIKRTDLKGWVSMHYIRIK